LRNKAEILEWEGRRMVPAGLATFAGVVLVVASAFLITGISGNGDAEVLRSVYDHSSSLTLSSILQAGGFVFLVAPLLVLFRAAAARSGGRVRYQLIGLVVAAPLFLAVSGVLTGISTNDAASEFVAGNAKPGITAKAAAKDCQAEQEDVGAKSFGEEYDGASPPDALQRCTKTRIADEEASNAISESSLHGAAIGFGLGGRLGLAVALLYSCLFAMRAGLLTRFWGSLGMALGVAALLLRVEFTMIWFIYFGLLLVGRLPGGRPPAWAAGTAIPWPTPGEKAAASLEGSEPFDPCDSPEAGGGGAADGERRKRKQRD
jgi:hypothetical protein